MEPARHDGPEGDLPPPVVDLIERDALLSREPRFEGTEFEHLSFENLEARISQRGPSSDSAFAARPLSSDLLLPLNAGERIEDGSRIAAAKPRAVCGQFRTRPFSMMRAFTAAFLLWNLVSACKPPGSTAGRRDTDAAAASQTGSQSNTGRSRPSVDERAMEVLAALNERDASRLARLAHPSRGIRFSPFAYVRSDSDVVIPAESVAQLFGDRTRRVWGHSDGTGDPITLTFDEYYKRYVYDVDFAAAPRRASDGPPIRSGNTPSNLRAAYPAGRWIEFHFPGFDDRYGGMDWRSLWLVFEEVGGQWLLVGVVHGSWTI